MAVFEYRCEKCSAEFEVEQPVGEPARTDLFCKRLNGQGHCYGTLRRQIPSSTNFVLKGRGWAKDGY